MARVASDGPFSAFPSIDRTLAVVKGSGLVLTIGGRPPVTLECGSDPISFAGDIPTSARLVAGEIIDLNVMTRRRRFSHQLRRLAQPASCDFDGHDIAVVLSLNASATLASAREEATLDHGDAAVLAPARDSSFRIVPATAGDCYLVLLRERQIALPASAGRAVSRRPRFCVPACHQAVVVDGNRSKSIEAKPLP
jgi:uncharacterized protein